MKDEFEGGKAIETRQKPLFGQSGQEDAENLHWGEVTEKIEEGHSSTESKEGFS